MWAVWPRILSDGETPVELIESAGWFPSRLAVTDATLFTRSEYRSDIVRVPTRNPLRSGWGLTQSNRLTHR